VKWKQSLKEVSEKKKAKLELLLPEDDTHNQTVCSSCKNPGHSRATSKLCPNNKPNIKELVTSQLGQDNEHFVISVPLDSFAKETFKLSLKEGITAICKFQREVLLKAMLFVNYYILSTDRVHKEFLKQNFWYSVCKVIYGNDSINGTSNQWPGVQKLENVYTVLIQKYPLFGIASPPTNSAHSLSSACINISTCYLS
jgi:hypothetical protein